METQPGKINTPEIKQTHENVLKQELLQPELSQEKKEQISHEQEIKVKFGTINNELKSLLEKKDKGFLSREEEEKIKSLNGERNEAVTNFKKLYGFDEKQNLPQIESVNKEGDANIIAINNYLGLNLPVFSKDLKTYESKDGNKYIHQGEYPGQDNGKGAIEIEINKRILAEKQVKFFEKTKEANSLLKKLSKEQIAEISKEIELEREAFNIIDRSMPERPQNEILSGIFLPYLQEAGKAGKIFKPEDKYYPKEIKGFNDAQITPDQMRDQFAGKIGIIAINQLLVAKKAKEKGLI